MKQTKETIKEYFQTGDKPTQEQYYDTWDSFIHKDDLEGYSETGTKTEEDLIVIIGDYDNSGVGLKIELDQNEGEFRFINGGGNINAARIKSNLLTSDRVINFPDKSGTIALKEDIDGNLSLISTNSNHFNAYESHIGGMNDVDSETNITLNIQDNAIEFIPVGSVLSYHQVNDGRIIVAYSGLASGDKGQTYKKGDVLTIWQKSSNNWVILNQPRALDSSLDAEPTGSNQVFNIVSLTQAEYDAGTPVATTLYNITDA